MYVCVCVSFDDDVCAQWLNHIQLFATPWIVALQALQSMEFSRQEHWSGLPLPTPGDLPNPAIKPDSLALQVDSSQSEPQGSRKGELYQTPFFTPSLFG